MRLLKFEDNNELSRTDFFDDNTPPYAILSHTWGANNEEVTLKDLENGEGKAKAGYKKILFCGNQAAKDNLQYFWVDTCCIDKSSSAELSESINAMFRWYQDAARCYVYLTDVSAMGLIGSGPNSQPVWNQALQRSRWFTRGWTLQELVAPRSVEFFSVEGERLGNKSSMVHEIHKISGISARALQGIPLGEFSVDERMSWAAKRETKRPEDAAYSLLGIFDICMPLIYAEGRKRAMIRLRKEIKTTLENESAALPPERPTKQLKRKHSNGKEKRGGQRDESDALPPERPNKQPKRKYGNDKEKPTGQRDVSCFKCGESGHYANEAHCNKCDEYGHVADDPHCNTCGEFGHYANEPHCFGCDIRGHFKRDCPNVETSDSEFSLSDL